MRRGAAGAAGLGGPWPLERPEADEAADRYDSLGSGSGGARSAAERPPSGRSKTVAALLAVFMPSGMFGLHRFYPDEWRAGLLYLAFFCRLTQTPTTIEWVRLDPTAEMGGKPKFPERRRRWRSGPD